MSRCREGLFSFLTCKLYTQFINTDDHSTAIFLSNVHHVIESYILMFFRIDINFMDVIDIVVKL